MDKPQRQTRSKERISKPIRQVLRNSQRTKRYSFKRHHKRINDCAIYLRVWGPLTFYLGKEAKDKLLADASSECWANVIGSFNSALYGLYRGSFFYLRSLIEYSITAFYFKHKGEVEISHIPRWKKTLRPSINKISTFQEYNRWCSKKKVYYESFDVLKEIYERVSKYEIHFGSETLRWKDVSPFYSRDSFILWSDLFSNTNEILLFMWFLFLCPRIIDDLENKKLNFVFGFWNEFLEIINKHQRKYLSGKNLHPLWSKNS